MDTTLLLPDLLDTPQRAAGAAARADVLVFMDTILSRLSQEPAARGLADLRGGRNGLHDWTCWLVIADWLDERFPPLLGTAVRNMVTACQSVRLPAWWCDFLKLTAGKRSDDAHAAQAFLKTLANKPIEV